MVVRISKGTFDPAGLERVEHLAVESEVVLRDALREMPGLVHCFVGIDREIGAITSVSVGHAGARASDGRARAHAHAPPDHEGRRRRVRGDHQPRGALVDHRRQRITSDVIVTRSTAQQAEGKHRTQPVDRAASRRPRV